MRGSVDGVEVTLEHERFDEVDLTDCGEACSKYPAILGAENDQVGWSAFLQWPIMEGDECVVGAMIIIAGEVELGSQDTACAAASEPLVLCSYRAPGVPAEQNDELALWGDGTDLPGCSIAGMVFRFEVEDLHPPGLLE